MKYCVEIVRDENNSIVQRNILFTTSQVCVMPRGKECLFVDGPDDIENILLKRASADQNGNVFIEDDPDKVAAKNLEDAIALRMKRQDFGRRLIAIIAIRNDAKNLTDEQKTQIASNNATMNQELLNGRIDIVKDFIQNLTPDGTLITQSDIDALLAEITANESSLGY